MVRSCLGKVSIFSPTEIVVFQEVHMGAEDDVVVVVVAVVVVTVLLLCFLSSLKFHQFGHDFVQLKGIPTCRLTQMRTSS